MTTTVHLYMLEAESESGQWQQTQQQRLKKGADVIFLGKFKKSSEQVEPLASVLKGDFLYMFTESFGIDI